MPAPEAISGVPPGLEYLAQIDQLLVHQQIQIFECEFLSWHVHSFSDLCSIYVNFRWTLWAIEGSAFFHFQDVTTDHMSKKSFDILEL